MAFAAGKKAWGISDRSGFRYRLREMRKEWNGSLVGPDEYEAKHPQLSPSRATTDNEALRNPRPDQAETLTVYVGRTTVETPNLAPLRAVGKVGTVTVTTS